MDYITVSLEEYKSLINDQTFLNCLVEEGVDGWDGYGMAYKAYKKEMEGDD